MIYIVGFRDISDLVYLRDSERNFSNMTVATSDLCDLLMRGYPVGFYVSKNNSLMPWSAAVIRYFSLRGMQTSLANLNQQAVVLTVPRNNKDMDELNRVASCPYSTEVYAVNLSDYRTVKRILQLWVSAKLMF